VTVYAVQSNETPFTLTESESANAETDFYFTFPILRLNRQNKKERR